VERYSVVPLERSSQQVSRPRAFQSSSRIVRDYTGRQCDGLVFFGEMGGSGI